ncbi:MAG: hypothetical protein AAF668_01705 [Pseudomonadota bacterium]
MTSLESYDEWKNCITVLCGIPLTEDYIDQRLAALRNPTDYKTQQFVEFWGAGHLERVVGWFEQAKKDVKANAGQGLLIGTEK